MKGLGWLRWRAGDKYVYRHFGINLDEVAVYCIEREGGRTELLVHLTLKSGYVVSLHGEHAEQFERAWKLWEQQHR